MTHQMNRSKSRRGGSPSKSRSRSSDKIINGTQEPANPKRTAPTFQLAEASPNLANRRASAFPNMPSTSSTRHVANNRSRSLKITRNASGTRLLQNEAALEEEPKPRSSIAHSLSVPGDEAEFHLVRNFSITSKGVINRGDSFRSSKSCSTSLCSTPTSPLSEESAFPVFAENDTGATSSSSCSASPVETSLCNAPPKYKVWLMGSNGVGKTSLKNQFMTSEYICQFESWSDENSTKSVIVSLDGEETELEIVECSATDDKNIVKDLDNLPDAFIIVYSVTNRRSYIQARQLLSKLETTFGIKAAILVANKTDLARLRTVSTFEGRSLAKERGCKFIETSVAINHQVDELLVGVITQIRIKAKIAEKQRKRSLRNSHHSRSKATCIIKRLWRRTCMTSKSCDNLHTL